MNNGIKVYVLESLQQGDKLTGTNLYNDLISYKLPFDSKLYDRIVDKGDWYKTIEDIRSNVKYGDVVFIHIEIHGNEGGTGVVLKNGETITFEKICEDFRDINKKIGCNLYITLAVCHGLYMIKGLVPLKEMPFCGLIGSQEEIKVSDLEIRYYEFYNSYLEYNDIESAMEQLKKANPDIPNSYRYIRSDEIFINSWKKYINDSSNKNWQKENLNKVSEENNFNRKQRRKFDRVFKKDKIKCAKSIYKEKTDLFFMLKDYPDNKNRFCIPKSNEIIR